MPDSSFLAAEAGRRSPTGTRGKIPEPASYLRIEERELEAGGLN
jgi:hypothetical protein